MHVGASWIYSVERDDTSAWGLDQVETSIDDTVTVRVVETEPDSGVITLLVTGTGDTSVLDYLPETLSLRQTDDKLEVQRSPDGDWETTLQSGSGSWSGAFMLVGSAAAPSSSAGSWMGTTVSSEETPAGTFDTRFVSAEYDNSTDQYVTEIYTIRSRQAFAVDAGVGLVHSSRYSYHRIKNYQNGWGWGDSTITIALIGYRIPLPDGTVRQGGDVPETSLEQSGVKYHRGSGQGTVPVDDASYYHGQLVTVLDSNGGLAGAIIRDGIRQRFRSWNTRADGNGTEYMPGDTFIISEETDLFAMYTTDSDVIGKIGPAGGHVFHDAGSTQSWGRYLEAAPADLEGEYVWGPSTSLATSTAIGAGRSNTDLILDASGTWSNAATASRDYGAGGFADWFVPSLNELVGIRSQLYNQGLGGFAPAMYWSSSQSSTYVGRLVHMTSTGTGIHSKGYPYRVRCVRAF